LITAVLSIVALICYIAMFATYKAQTKFKNGMLFAVTLPEHAADHPDIQSIRSAFNRRMLRTAVGMAAAFVPFVLLRQWSAFQLLYLFLWLLLLTVVTVLPFRRAFRDTLELKREKEWFVGAKRVIIGDLRVSMLKNKRAASLWLFAVPFAVAGGLAIWAWLKDSPFYGIFVGGIAVTAALLLTSILMRRSKAIVFSENSEINLVLNQARRRALSYLWLAVAIIENVHFLLIFLHLSSERYDLNGIWMTVILLFAAFPAALVVYVYRSLQAREREIVANDGRKIYTDDDEYWANGFTYHNPQDTSLFVPKRVGVGETINTGTLAGKLLFGGKIGLMAVVIIGVSFLLIRSELTSPSMAITSDRHVHIDYPMYSFSFRSDEIRELTLADTVPAGVKTSGEATGKFARGHFRLEGEGKARLYVFRDNPPYIRLKLDDVVIYYNDKDPEKTRQLYAELEALKQ